MHRNRNQNPILFLNLLTALAVCAPAFAQAVFSPLPAYSSMEGNLYSHRFGGRSKERAQLADGSLRTRRMTIKSIAYRADYHDYDAATTGMGRSWTQVTLNMSEFDMARMTSSPGANVTGTATLVFSGPATWPTMSGLPLVRPAVLWRPTFPFKKPWVYSGKQDILCDYTFAGGALANRRTWSGWVSYFLDSYAYGTGYYGPQYSIGRGGLSAGCGDTGNSNPKQGAFTGLAIFHYGPNHQAAKNMIRANYFGFFLGRNTNCVTAIGTKLLSRGVTVPGVSCQKLYIDFSGPLAIFFNKTTNGPSHGEIPSTFLTGTKPGYVAPVVPAWIGVWFVAQSAWTDTVTGQLKLTAAGLTMIPPMTPWQTAAQVPRKALYEFHLGAWTFREGPSQLFYYNNICAYGQ